MRQAWIFFFFAMVTAGLSATFVRGVRAEGEGALRTIEKSELRAPRNPVPEFSALEKSLKEREDSLLLRETELREAEDRLRAEELRLKARVQELEEMYQKLDSTEKRLQTRSDDVMKRMIKTFESMAPKKAAGVISVMKDPLAVELLMQMKEKKVASILDVMDPNRAMALSSMMAARRPAGSADVEEQARPRASGTP